MSRAAEARAGQRPLHLLPDPDRQWIRYAPRSWPYAPSGGGAGSGAPPLWLDLVRDRLGSPGQSGVADLELPTGPFDDVLYLPPVAAELRAARDRAAAEVAARGTPVLVQLLPGERAPETAGIVPLYDLLEPLVTRDLAVLGQLPTRSAAVWPLVAGLTDSPTLREDGVRRLADSGVAVLQAVSPDLPPADRRRLFESGTATGEGRDATWEQEAEEEPIPIPEERLDPNRPERSAVAAEGEAELFHRLFHTALPDPRSLVRAAHAHGLAPFLPRPLPRPPLTGAANREAAGLLALAGEIHLRLGRLVPSQACFRAARWIDQSNHSLRALAREGNLHVLPWLDPRCRSIVDEWSEAGDSATVEALLAEYSVSARAVLPVSETGPSLPRV